MFGEDGFWVVWFYLVGVGMLGMFVVGNGLYMMC